MNEINASPSNMGRNQKWYSVTVIFLSLCITIFIISYNRSEALANIYTMPLCFSVLYFILERVIKCHKGFSFYIINTLAFIRFTIIPLVIVLGENNYTTVNEINRAIVFLLYELFMVFFVEYLCLRDSKSNETYDKNDSEIGIIGQTFIVLSIILFALIIIRNPKLRNGLLNFIVTEESGSPLSGGTQTTGFELVFFKIGLSIVFCTLLPLIHKFTPEGNLSFLFSVIISIMYISCDWSNGASISRWGLLFNSVTAYILLVYFYPNRKKFLLSFGSFLFLIVMLVTTIQKTYLHHGSYFSEAISEIFSEGYLNAYFQGPYSIIEGVNAMIAFSNKISFTTFLDDTCSAYPLINSFFYEEGNSTELYYCNYISRDDKILPTIVQGYAYFGTLFSPLFSVFLTAVGLRLDSIQDRTNNVYRKVAILQISLWTSLFMAVNVYIIQRTTMYYVLILCVFEIDHLLKNKKKT